MEQRLELELGRDSIGVTGGSLISLETVLGVRLGCRLQLQGFNIHSPSGTLNSRRSLKPQVLYIQP